MKRKSLFVHGDVLIKWHALIYIVFTVGLWWSVMSTFNYPGNVDVPFSAYQGFILSRIGVTMFWGLVFILHFASHQMRSYREQQARQTHLKTVNAMQERYVSGARLDMDVQAANEADGIDDEALETAYYERQRRQLR